MADENKKDSANEEADDVVYSTSGLQENTAAVMAYLLVFFTGILFIFNEKDSGFVRFHAMQSTLVFLPILIVMIIFNYIPGGSTVNMVIVSIAVVLWLFLMFKAFRKEYYKLPFIGQIAENLHKKTE